MEEGLLLKLKGKEREGGRRGNHDHENNNLTAASLWGRSCGGFGGVFMEEVKMVGYIAGPMVAVTLSQFLIQVFSMVMVGHISELSLSSTALASSLINVTGFSLLLGMANGLETLCGQAFGAQQYRQLGVHTYSAIISLTFVCLLLSFIWISIGKLLTFIGQDPLISLEAGRYAAWSIPALFAYAILQPIMKFLQCQSLIIPMLLSSFAILCFHIPTCWVLVFKFGLGNVGAALAIGVSYWLNVIILGLYIKYSLSCEGTRAPLSKEAFLGVGKFLRLALPSAIMICLEWWSFEIVILLSGLLPNPKLETSVLSICLTTISLLYAIPSGVGAGTSTRVSNELGAGRPRAARLVVCVVMIIAVTETLTVSFVLFSCRNILGYAYSNEKEVVDYVTEMVPLICFSVIMDSVQGILSGVARGCGWQHLGAYVNLCAFYLAGVPIAYVLGFYLQLGGRGLWIGVLTGSIIQSALLSLITFRTNWEEQAKRARERVFEGEVPTENLLH